MNGLYTLTSSTGAVSDTYTYDAYGKTLTSTGSVYNPFKYTGEYTDSESGFIYLRARYYDPESQQFLTVDPALAWTEEAYAYVGGNPTNLRDPWGLDGCGWFPNFFDANSCVRKGLDTEAGKWVAGVGVVAAGGVVIICIASGVCEVAAAGAAVVGGAEAENQLATVTENAVVNGEACSMDAVSVFHGSIKNGAEILRNGLDPSRAPVFVSRDIAAAEDALRNHYDRIPGLGTIIESKIPTSEFLTHLSPLERPYTGFYPYGIQSTEIPLGTSNLIELFNRYIVR